MRQVQIFTTSVLVTVLAFAVINLVEETEAGQGCPFDDGSCQEYCSQQGCNMGYCGHFAWIQCICRKCGDEWSWYDKVRYNPDKTVNQTELDSLKLNGTTPLILTNSSAHLQQQQQHHQQANNVTKSAQQENNKQTATLTTLLIPDLSETNGKLDLNDIPDENSDKFLDYLAKNHEKLVQATSQVRTGSPPESQAQSPNNNKQQSGDDEMEDDEEQVNSSTPISLSAEERDDETIEIQISSSNNNTSGQISATTTTTTNPNKMEQPRQVGVETSPVTRLLKMAVVERTSEEID